MLMTVISALLPIIVTLMMGFIAAWHHDFDAKQATVLSRMVMLYALPVLLFVGILAVPRSQLTADLWLGAVIFIAMVLAFCVPLVIARYFCGRDLMTSSLQALAIGGASFGFVGVPVLGYLFGPVTASVPVAVGNLVMNVMQVPACMILLSIGAAQAESGKQGSYFEQVVAAFKQPVVWAPMVAFAIMAVNFDVPDVLRQSLELLSNATSGVALFASGIILYSRRISINLPVAISVAARNLLVPAAVWGAVSAIGLSPESSQEAVLTMAIPTASVTVILAVQFRTAEQEIASVLFFSTALSVLTMGVFIWLMGA